MMTEEELLDAVVNDAVREYLDDGLKKGGISCPVNDADEFVSRLERLGYKTDIMMITPDPGDHDYEEEEGEEEENYDYDCIVFFWDDAKEVVSVHDLE